MSKLSDSEIQNAWDEVQIAAGSDEALTEMMSRFGQSQPSVFEFISEASARWEADAADLVFHAALVIWTCFQSRPLIESDLLLKKFAESTQWLNGLSGESVLLQKKLADFSKYSEPELMRYMVELVFEAHEDGLEIEPEEQEQILLVLKTLIEAFAQP